MSAMSKRLGLKELNRNEQDVTEVNRKDKRMSVTEVNKKSEQEGQENGCNRSEQEK